MRVALVDTQTLRIITDYPNVPDCVVWPNGDATHCPVVGDEREGHRLVNVVYTPDCPNEFYVLGDEIPSLSQDTLTVLRSWNPIDLDSIRVALSAQIDRQAEVERLKHITDGIGQSLVYSAKQAEAVAYLRDPTIGDHPLLDASTPAGEDVKATAMLIVSKAAAWTQVASSIERKRLNAKTAIKAAQSAEEIFAASAVKWKET